MKIFKNKSNLLKEISKIKDLAFVPTMGSIHKGHLSLINKAKKVSKNVLISIYINPKQFNSNLDFKKYPNNIKKDINLLRKNNIKYLYLPNYFDIYSFKTKCPLYDDKFSKKLCGKFRPRHFKGVINVINRFLEILKPRSIFLGMKDYQQLALIKSHIKKNKIKTKVFACPTIRNKGGVALSSRNINLDENDIKKAIHVYKYLKINKKEILLKILIKKKIEIINKIKKIGIKKIDYLECINMKTHKTLKKKNSNFNIFIAYYIKKIRLIDNL